MTRRRLASSSAPAALWPLLLLAACHLFVACNSSREPPGGQETSWQPLGLAPSSRRLTSASALDSLSAKWSRVPVGLRAIQLRGPARERASAQKRAAAAAAGRHKFFYVIAPVSEQALPFQSDRLAQGYTNLLPLSGGYQTGLQKLTDPSDEWAALSRPNELLASSAADFLGCRPSKTRVQLAQDELEPATGSLVRHCVGAAELNTCEGSCPSSVQPSIRAPGGLAKSCACCNEGAFRRVRVRLSECFAGGDQRARLPGSFLDLEVDEPSECKCRPCASLL